MNAEEPALPDYPGHTAAFGRIMHGSGLDQGSIQGRVRVMRIDVRDLMKVTDEELIILNRLPIREVESVDLEMARRTVTRTTEALALLGTSLDNLRKVTDEAATRTTDAIGSLESSVDLTTGEVRDLSLTVERLHDTTEAAGITTRAAMTQLDASIQGLRISGDRWSRRLTLLTIGLFALTVGLLAVAVGQLWR